MRIRCRVVQISGCLWLSGIAKPDDSTSLRNFFLNQGLSASIDAEGHILLLGLTIERFIGLVQQENIELI